MKDATNVSHASRVHARIGNRRLIAMNACRLQPYDKFAGLYGAKTYWGYDGADTGEDPFEARMWDNRQPAHARPPKQWDGYVPDHGGFDDRKPAPRVALVLLCVRLISGWDTERTC